MTNTKDILLKTKYFAEENRKKSWSSFLTLLTLLAVAVTGATLQGNIYIRSVFSVFTGLLLIRMFIFYHDYHHGAIFRKSTLAKWILNFYGVLVLAPPVAWRSTHNSHHDHNAQISFDALGAFPIMTTEEYKNASLGLRLKYIGVRNPLFILLSYLTVFIMRMCVVPFLNDPRRHFDSLIAVLLHGLIIFALTLLGWDYVIFSVFIPLFVALTMGAYLFYIQHNAPSIKLKPIDQWDYGFAAMNSSSFLEGGKFLHWISGNIGYHNVHHANCLIPFYRLPEAMAAIPELQNPARSSLKPIDIYKCLRLKLWDLKQNKLVGY